ncbi:hypothetical protein O3G_MSEX014153 [Manduca sexta]|uniref:Uncharacterized protein n=1 Tax=Manduca sexta TaxID=7130 RepID=A0A921ZUD0_MANSE|nr:hypothetical protein O3G_MSEX014153 [Manduca sexta]
MTTYAGNCIGAPALQSSDIIKSRTKRCTRQEVNLNPKNTNIRIVSTTHIRLEGSITVQVVRNSKECHKHASGYVTRSPMYATIRSSVRAAYKRAHVAMPRVYCYELFRLLDEGSCKKGLTADSTPS